MRQALNILAALALCVSLATAGCMVVEEAAGDGAAEVATCSDDGDCPAGLVCDGKVHVCVVDERFEMEAWFRFVPPAQGVLAVEEQYPGMIVDSTEDVSITLHRPVRVVGRVLLAGNPLLSQQAQIVAVAQGTVPDLNIHQDAKATDSFTYDYESGQTDKPGFQFWVNEDKSYDIYVYLSDTPDGQEYPPYHMRWSFSQRDNPGDPYTYEWDIEVPPMEEYLHLTGCVKRPGDEVVPLVGAQVVATSDETGNWSTTSITDAAGCFDLAVQPLVDVVPETYRVMLRPSPDNELVPAQTLTEVEVTDTADLGDFYVKGLEALSTVTVTLAAQADTPVAAELSGKGAEEQAMQLAQEKVDALTTELTGTLVRFTGKVGDGMLQVERSVKALTHEVDSVAGTIRVTAQVEFLLPPRSYVLSVIPKADGRFGIKQELLHLDPDAEEQWVDLALAPKAETLVRVTDPDGAPLPDAEVMAVLAGKGNFPETAPLPVRKYLPEPDPEEPGTYRFSLDPGVYTIVVNPPAQSGLPRHIERECYVHGSSQQRNIEVPPPAVLTGVVYGTLPPLEDPAAVAGSDSDPATPGGSQLISGAAPYTGPVPGVKVELFDEHEALSDPDGVAPIPLSAGFTDDTGRFILIVPAR